MPFNVLTILYIIIVITWVEAEFIYAYFDTSSIEIDLSFEEAVSWSLL